jgi:hypothetical protein
MPLLASLEWSWDDGVIILGTAAAGTATPAERMRIASDGKVGIGNTPAVDLDVTGEIRASTGILFGTDTAAANKLDDYEEGTWTPTWTGGGSLTGSFVYTKIGRVVYISGQLNVFGTTSGDLDGLPFSGAYDGRETGVVGYQNVNADSWTVLKVGSTSFRFYAGSTQQQAINGSDIRFSFFYTV